MAHEPSPYADITRRELDRLARQVFVTFGCWVAGAGLLLVAWIFFHRPAAQFRGLMTLMSVTLGVWVLAWWVARRGYARQAMIGSAVCAIIAVGGIAYLVQTGLQAPALALMPLLIALAGGFANIALAVGVAALSAVTIGVLFWLEQAGLIQRLAASTEMAPLVFVASHLTVIGVALLAATLISGILVNALRRAIEQEQRFKALLAIGADWYWEQDAELRYTFFSDSYAQVTGMDPTARLGLQRTELPGIAVDASLLRAHLADLAARRPFRNLVTDQKMPDGSLRYFSVSGEPRFDTLGRFVGYWGVTRDVTLDVQARQTAGANEAQYRNLFMGSPMPTVIHRDRKLVMINSAALRLLRRTAASVPLGTEISDLFDPKYLSLMAEREAALARLPLGEPLPLIELELPLPGGRVAQVQVSSARVQLQDGPAVQTLLIDLSAIRQSEAALQRSDLLLAKIYETTVDAVSLSNLETGRIEYVNPAFTRMFGVAAQEAVGRSREELQIWERDEDRSALRAQLDEHGEARMPAVVLRARDGSRLTVQLLANAFMLAGKRYLLVVHHDITEVERARLLSQTVLDNALIGIAVTRDMRLIQANPRLAEMFGAPLAELVGQPLGAMLPDPEVMPAFADSIRAQIARGVQPDVTIEFRRRDNTRFWARVRVQLLDPTNLNGGMVAVVHDISAERESQQALASAKERAEAASLAKSAFLANISHEIRTPLNAVLGLARLARTTEEPERRHEYLGRLSESAESLVSIISDTLDLAKIEAGKLSLEQIDFDLPRLLQSVHQTFLDAALDRGLVLTLEFAPDLPKRVTGDPVRLRQILSNFVSNAIKFTEQGSVTLRAARFGTDRLLYEIVDTGIGIAPSAAARLFTPFMQADDSTTRRYGGTGLGLSICRELAQLMGGDVGVESELGRGSRFWADLPLVAAASSEIAGAADLVESAALSGARVLLVEDNELNRLIATTMLQSWGIEVVEAVDGEQGLAAVQREEGRFDLVLMDVHMPVMNGYEATRQVRLTYDNAQLPIVALTAAALASEREQALAVGMDDFVSKPIDVDQLRAALSRWIRRGAAQVAQPN